MPVVPSDATADAPPQLDAQIEPQIEPRIEMVFFDIGGVMYDDTVYARSWMKALRESGAVFTDEEFEREYVDGPGRPVRVVPAPPDAHASSARMRSWRPSRHAPRSTGRTRPRRSTPT